MSTPYKGRPSYASIARRHGELNNKSSKTVLKAITKRIDALSPNQFTVIEPEEHLVILEDTLRNHIARANRLKHCNLKLHKPNKNPNAIWYVWNCPDSRKFNRYGTAIDPTKPKRLTPLQSSGSIHATTAQVLSTLSLTSAAFDALPFDQQMKLRIETGIALRDTRTKAAKLNQIFKAP
jgi:hypothetical protein